MRLGVLRLIYISYCALKTLFRYSLHLGPLSMICLSFRSGDTVANCGVHPAGVVFVQYHWGIGTKTTRFIVVILKRSEISLHIQ